MTLSRKRQLVLVRHSHPEIVTGVRACDWVLSDKGRDAAIAFARDFEFGTARCIWTSAEPKAAETARLLAAQQGLDVSVDRDLGEHRRGPVSRDSSAATFTSQVEQLLRDPSRCGLGEETGEAALQRFARAVDKAIDCEGDSDVVIVAHGTVISLFAESDVERRVALWMSLGFPAEVRRSVSDEQPSTPDSRREGR